MDALRRECRSGADLVCVMAANNEVGTIYDTRAVCELAAETGASTLIDATQAAGRVDLRFSEWGATYMVFSAHKMYGPKGAGALVTDACSIPRSEGTPNVPAFAGLGEACRLRRLEMDEDEPAAAGLRDRLQKSLLNAVPGLVINGDPEARLSHSLHVSVPDVPNDVVISLVRGRVALSTGSACHSGALEPSHVLRAMDLSPALQEGALRMAVGKFNHAAEIDAAAEYLSSAIARARAVL
jgi:cysteine desulfurase